MVEAPYVGSVACVERYINDLRKSGLMDACTYFIAGINGGEESRPYGDTCLPMIQKATHLYHGGDWRSSNATSEAMRVFAVEHPGWNVLHFHAKGIAHNIPQYESYHAFEDKWIACMVNACIYNWRTCVSDLETHDAVGCHWMENVGSPPVDHIFGGTFWWATSDFIATLPPLSETPLVKQFGIKHFDSRATSEQYIGLGPQLPRVKDYCPGTICSHM